MRRITKEERTEQINERIEKEKLPYELIDVPEKCSANSYITLKCKVHDFVFKASIISFLYSKSKCSKCQKNYHYSKEEYTQRINDKIKKDKSPYIFIGFNEPFRNAHSKIKMYCKHCNKFWNITINNFFSNKGCPVCNKSKGEQFIANLLSKNNILFRQEERFEGCKDKIKLPFDFYIPKYKLLIEYDGKQHFEDGWFGNKENLLNTQYHDKLKNEWAENNNYVLIRYNYTQSFKYIENNLLGILNSYESRKK